MAHFGKDLWPEIAPRFRQLRAGEKVEKFLADNDLLGLKWRAMEDGRQGISVESLAKLCDALDASPTWLIFGVGPQQLSAARKLKSISLAGGITDALLREKTSSTHSERKTSGKK